MTGTAAAPRLEVRDLDVGYRRAPVLTGITLPPLEGGSLVAVLGANGAGKSTFLRALAGQLSYRGSLRLAGSEIRALAHDQRLARIGYVPQSLPQPSALLAYEYALSALRAATPGLSGADAEARIERAFARLGLVGHALMPVSALSGGQRQLLGLSRVFARDTPLTLLDEPTSALDLRWEVEAMNAMREQAAASGTLFLVAMHDINLAMRFCDRLVLFTAGRLAAEGPVEEAVTPELLRRAYGVEARIETCSRGRPLVLADLAAPPAPAHPA